MSRSCLTTVVLVFSVLGGGAIDAQEKPQADQKRSANASPSRPVETAKVLRNVPNVQIEVTISDTTGSAPAQKKTAAVTVTDGHMGRIRSSRSAGGPTLNIDATPAIVDNTRIRLQMTLEYRAPWPDEKQPSSSINEMITVTLDNGTVLMVSQATDPALDRRVTVEVKATILK